MRVNGLILALEEIIKVYDEQRQKTMSFKLFIMILFYIQLFMILSEVHFVQNISMRDMRS